jgi:hypothetical protein
MRNIAPSPSIRNLTLIDWATRHRRQPWQIRHLARRHYLPIRMAATIAEIIGMGGTNER